VKSLVRNVLRYPLSSFVVGDHLLLDGLNLNEPTVEPTINQGSLRSPAEGIAMLNGTFDKHAAHVLKVVHNLVICSWLVRLVLDVHSSVLAHHRSVAPILINWHRSISRLNQALC
jgi:hypothetical protein